ncbi:hypothetical protein DMUE_2115 [Dictyocoela muelleri]|nr:hypothetical protein DMUE_2115 [Dictyocoela muelleri]
MNIIDKYYQQVGQTGGECIKLEVDESKFGMRKYERGHVVDGFGILGAVERTDSSKKIFLKKCSQLNSETLISFLRQNVHHDSIIFSDGGRGYSNLDLHFSSHFRVNHSEEFVNQLNGVHINTIEGCGSGIKKVISFRNRSEKFVSLYLLRFMLNRNKKERAFDILIKLIFN